MEQTVVTPGKEKNKGGRPKKINRDIKYEPRFARELVDFFKVDYFRKEVKSVGTAYDKDGNVKFERKEYFLFPNRLPTIFLFCENLGISQDRFYEWVDYYEDFGAAYARARELYKDFLVQNGLSKLYDSTFTMFVARNTTDLKDKPPVEELQTFLEAVRIAAALREEDKKKALAAPKTN